MAPGGQLPQPSTTIGAREPADRDGHAVDQPELRVELDLGDQVLVQALLDRPQIRCLPHKGRAVDAPQGGEPVAVVATEVLVQAFVGVDAKELPDALDVRTSGSDKIGWGRAGAAAGRQPVVDQAVHGDEQRPSIHA
jgi:hypothetical protein